MVHHGGSFGRNHLLAKEVRRELMKLNFDLLLCPLNQVNTKSVFLHWLTFVNALTFSTILAMTSYRNMAALYELTVDTPPVVKR